MTVDNFRFGKVTLKKSN